MLKALNERSQVLLNTLVSRYIRDGEPVGSKALVAESSIKISPATARNVMADLEAHGYLQSPHTSAGRVPTVLGYRYFVDSLLSVQNLDSAVVASQIEEALISLTGSSLTESSLTGSSKDISCDNNQLVMSASEILSEVSQLAGVITTPKRQGVVVQQVEFLPLSEQRVLAVIVTSDMQVQNRVLTMERTIQRSELEQASNYLNAHYSGRTMDEIRSKLLMQMKQAHRDMDTLMQSTLTFAEHAFTESAGVNANKDNMVVAGQNNLMHCKELGDVEKLRGMFDAFNQKQDLLDLLDSCSHSPGMQIFIGAEAGIQVFDECAMVTAPYACDGEIVGTLGVIGPTRMAYDRVIPVVDATAKLLSKALK